MFKLFRPSPLASLGFKGPKCINRSLSVLRQNFYEGDCVWLRPLDGGRPHWRVLDTGRDYLYTSKGAVLIKDVIGKSAGDVVQTKKQELLRLDIPSLAEYIRYTERLVTPIYPCDASDIISLVDLHVVPATEQGQDTPELEILEAGTGHGALTLYLAQLLQAANPPLTAPVLYEARQGRTGESQLSLDALKAYKARRNAVLHTFEFKKEVSDHARKIIGSFRGGMYAPHVDLHHGDVHQWLEDRLAAQDVDSDGAKQPFLRHVFLDLPDVHKHIELAQQAVHPGGTILVFCPSISQIEHLVTVAHEKQLPLIVDRVVELSSNTSGGRNWDVRVAKIRSSMKTPSQAASSAADSASATEEEETIDEEEALEELQPDSRSTAEADTGDTGEPATSKSDRPREIRSQPFVSISGETRYGMVVRPKPSALRTRCAFVAVLRRCYPEELKNRLSRDDWYGSAARSQHKGSKRLSKRRD